MQLAVRRAPRRRLLFCLHVAFNFVFHAYLITSPLPRRSVPSSSPSWCTASRKPVRLCGMTYSRSRRRTGHGRRRAGRGGRHKLAWQCLRRKLAPARHCRRGVFPMRHAHLFSLLWCVAVTAIETRNLTKASLWRQVAGLRSGCTCPEGQKKSYYY